MKEANMIDQPLTLPNGVVLANRLVKSAMSEALGDARSNTTEAHIGLFDRWGRSGAALLITGNTPVDRLHLEHAGNVVLDKQTDLARTARLAEAAKRGGARVLVQLAHAGRQTPEAVNRRPLSMSGLRLDLPGYGAPRAATEEDLERVIGQFEESARLAKVAGFDGVEVHAAHGYLLSSALSPRINTRSDRWGGSLENRARLVLSIIRAVRRVGGPGFTLAVKLNSSDFQKGGFSHEDSIAVAKLLQDEGIDLLEISGGNFETPVAYQHGADKNSSASREAYFLDYARDIKAALTVPVMVTGGFRSRDVMNEALTSGATDLIGMGRPFIIDPAFPGKLLSGVIDRAPAVERDFPAAATLPRGAVLNWFCHQLALQGNTGAADLSLPVVEGHARYLADLETATEWLLEERGSAS